MSLRRHWAKRVALVQFCAMWMVMRVSLQEISRILLAQQYSVVASVGWDWFVLTILLRSRIGRDSTSGRREVM